MKKRCLLLIFSLLTAVTRAQDFGLSFSYFIPKNGYFSAPVSPFSMRGLGVDLNRAFAIETGATLYRVTGLGLKDLPFEYNGPIAGANFTLFIPAELVLMIHAGGLEIDLKGGGFFFYAFDQHLNYGHLDRAIKTYEGWSVANTSATFKTYPGWGYHAGTELTFPVAQQFGASLEVNYLLGQAKFPISGTYTGGNTAIETRTFSFADARMDFSGVEISIGVFYQTGRTAIRRKRK